MRKKLLSLLLALVLAVGIPYTSASAAAVWGDVNGDQKFSATDAVMVLRFITGEEIAITTIADADDDGEITASDAVLLLRGLIKPSLKTEGFTVDFQPDVSYYLCAPENFDTCSIIKYNGFMRCDIQVEQYGGHCPYSSTPYVLGEPLRLGNGRAKVSITGTLPDGTVTRYLIALADPNPEGNTCAFGHMTSGTSLRATANSNGKTIATLKKNERVLYLRTEGSRCVVEQLNTGLVGYVPKGFVQWGWKETSMPAEYADAIQALKNKHPNWSFTFVDVEMTMEQALSRYGSGNVRYIDPKNYLTESHIYAMLDVRDSHMDKWTDIGIAAIWTRTSAVRKSEAVTYFKTAAQSLGANPYYITCRAALESGYGTSKFAKGTVSGYEGYYNFYGIRCYDRNPTLGASYAKERNWDSLLCSIVEGANWVKDQYIDQGAVTPYFFRFAGFQNKEYMSDPTAPMQEATILRRAFANSATKAHFIIPVYR